MPTRHMRHLVEVAALRRRRRRRPKSATTRPAGPRVCSMVMLTSPKRRLRLHMMHSDDPVARDAALQATSRHGKQLPVMTLLLLLPLLLLMLLGLMVWRTIQRW